MRTAMFLMGLVCSLAIAADTPRTPCAGDPNPPYAGVGQDPAVRAWVGGKGGLRLDSACTPSLSGTFRLVAALSGSFRSDGDVVALLARFGAVSQIRGIRYWSVSNKRWADLITRSSALTGPRGAERADFAAAEMKIGQDLFFVQSDTSLTSDVGYRMRIVKAEKEQIIVEFENVTPLKFFVTLFEPGELRTVHFLTRHSHDVWNYYLLTAVNGSRAEGNKSSIINRAAALYRYVAAQQTDREPPLAPDL